MQGVERVGREEQKNRGRREDSISRIRYGGWATVGSALNVPGLFGQRKRPRVRHVVPSPLPSAPSFALLFPPSPPHSFRVARVLATGQGILFCNRCGSYTSGRHPRDLVGGCHNVKKQQVHMLRNGRLPWPRGPLGRISPFWAPGARAPEGWGDLFKDEHPHH